MYLTSKRPSLWTNSTESLSFLLASNRGATSSYSDWTLSTNSQSSYTPTCSCQLSTKRVRVYAGVELSKAYLEFLGLLDERGHVLDGVRVVPQEGHELLHHPVLVGDERALLTRLTDLRKVGSAQLLSRDRITEESTVWAVEYGVDEQRLGECEVLVVRLRAICMTHFCSFDAVIELIQV